MFAFQGSSPKDLQLSGAFLTRRPPLASCRAGRTYWDIQASSQQGSTNDLTTAGINTQFLQSAMCSVESAGGPWWDQAPLGHTSALAVLPSPTAPFPSLPHLFPSPVLPGIIFQINHLHSCPCLGLSFCENPTYKP